MQNYYLMMYVGHLIVLPQKHWVTKLIVEYFHEKGNHNSGANQTLSMLSTKYWIIAARKEIMDWERERKCATCKRRKTKQVEPEVDQETCYNPKKRWRRIQDTGVK